MKKQLFFILSLLLVISFFGTKASAAEKQVEVWLHTWEENGKVEGTDQLMFEVYDLTDWRTRRPEDAKKAKEYLLNTYATKEKMAAFVKHEQLTKVNTEALIVDGSGNLSFELPRYREGKDAAYLILASGETGEHHLLPIILYLPQKHPETQEEAERLLIYGKYQVDSLTPPQDSSNKGENSNPQKSSADSPVLNGAAFPATNDLIRDYTIIGLLLMVVGLIGFKLNKKRN
ncbi:pilin N-terminal domain-containing protein [Enterococcus devriesei]|uniref:pilin N-terminal domain-containing protein n=1 Tax=Enterococcus TaxID=1350 RepID=UPI00288D5E80|nr:pilin N-terminal domain-containing protein [Enterococcus devriesei]MDT2822108.1 pilin N-terminal domain-containing protein [Enterococcus devriesei]